MADIQAEAEKPDETTVADPVDTANSTNSGTNSTMDDYRAEVAAMLRLAESDEQGEQPVEEEPEVKAKDRFRFKDALDQKVAAVAKAMGVSLIEAAKIVEGQTPTKHQEQQAEAEVSESVADVTAQIKALQAQKKEELSSLNFEAAADLDEQIDTLRDKRDDLKTVEAQSKATAEQAESAKFYAEYEQSEIKTVGLYPDAAVKDSPMAKEMAKLEAEMRELGDPLYHSADKPFILAKEAAKNLGIPMRKPGTEPAKKSVQHRPIQPAGGNARTTAADPSRKATETIEGITSMRDYRDLVNSL